MMRRAGASILAVVMFCSAVIWVSVAAYHFLWRGSSRTLYSVQEHRELINLARSALAEAYFKLQIDLDLSARKWFDWCTTKRKLPVELFDPSRTRTNAESMSPAGAARVYTASDVTMERVVGLDRSSDGGQMGIVDFKVTVSVARSAPNHQASLTLTERRYFWLADNLGTFGAGGRHVEVSPTPAMTKVERN